MRTASQDSCTGWLDLDEDDQRRAREYLSQFNSDNTLDELGFGIIRDAFADVFFPATNTLMTRTRYLIFVPALCLAIEDDRLAGKTAERRLTELENGLRESLQKEEPRGVIGEIAKESLRRYPSSIYWRSLRQLGIFLHRNWGLAYYQSHLEGFYHAMKAERDDDGLTHLNDDEHRNWDRDLCSMLANGCSIAVDEAALAPLLNFTLTRHEAHYLRTKFRALDLKEGRPSLLSHLLDLVYQDSFGYPWDVPCPPPLAPYVGHARCFSVFTRGATLQYFHLLQRERETQGIAQPSFDISEAFVRWWQATHEDLANWHVDDFLSVANHINGLRRANDAIFIRRWLKVAVEATSARGLLESAEAHELIRQRERTARPCKSRLYHPEYLRRWNPPTAAEIRAMTNNPDALPFGLDYRAGVGSTFVRDIADGLAGAP